MGEITRVSRRDFLRVSAAAGGGLLLGLHLPGRARAASAAPEAEPFAPNAWIRIAPDDTVTLLVARSEMGQGVYTALPMLLAEELEADWSRVHVEMAPADPAYTNRLLGRQATGGSTAIRDAWPKLREAGATARHMLEVAAAQRWGVKPGQCQAKQGVVHGPGGRSATFGELAEAAAELSPPESVDLKDPADYTLVGTDTSRLDARAKVTGTAEFGMDVRLEGLLTATVQRCPVLGGRVESVDGSEAEARSDVHRVLNLGDRVAVVADGYWAAKQGLDTTRIQWAYGEHGGLSSAGIEEQFRRDADSGEAATVTDTGDAEARFEEAADTLEAEYEVPFLAHACMEPMNCTARVDGDTVEVWAPTQNQTDSVQAAAEAAGVAPERVTLHTTFLGGGFGRRSMTDFVSDAAAVASAVGAPVQVIWSREETTRHDGYRPAAYNRLSAAFDSEGKPTAWRHRISGPSIMAANGMIGPEQRVDSSSVEAAKDVPYSLPAVRVDYTMSNTPVPLWWWRSVGNSQNGFIREHFADEVARAAGEDPLQFRLDRLGRFPGHRRVLERAAQAAGWDDPLGEGRGRGIAVVECFGSTVAEVAEVTVAEDRTVSVDRVVCAADCGPVVNPDILRQQMESGIAYGLSAMLHEAVTIERGQVEQGNFDDYPILRAHQMPEIEVELVEGQDSPGGAGEPGLPPAAPAVANAILAATGKPVRRLPIGRSGFQPA
jgi:isoquinoline 1-oxidoreductase beta subunit